VIILETAALNGISLLKIYTQSKIESFVLRLDMVTHICNPSYSGGRDMKDCSSRPDCGKN
jgi:hypothetical protein